MFVWDVKMEIISFIHDSFVPTGITVTQSGSVWVLGLNSDVYLFNTSTYRSFGLSYIRQ